MAIEPDGPADQAGIAGGRRASSSLGEQPVTSVDDLHKLLTQLPVGVPATVVLLRGAAPAGAHGVAADYPHPAPSGLTAPARRHLPIMK